MVEPHVRGKVKFLIPGNGNLLINDVPAKFTPPHYLIACAINLISKDIALEIFRQGQEAAVVASKLVPGLLGGYAELVQENPLIYKYLGGSSSLVSATEEQFNEAQKGGNITFHKFTKSNVTEESLFK